MLNLWDLLLLLDDFVNFIEINSKVKIPDILFRSLFTLVSWSLSAPQLHHLQNICSDAHSKILINQALLALGLLELPHESAFTPILKLSILGVALCYKVGIQMVLVIFFKAFWFFFFLRNRFIVNIRELPWCRESLSSLKEWPTAHLPWFLFHWRFLDMT